jgi:hypothetical protein
MIETCEDQESGTCKDQGSGTYEDLESGTCEGLEIGTCEVLKSRIREDRELQQAVIIVNKGFEDQGEAKSKTSSQKSGFRV